MKKMSWIIAVLAVSVLGQVFSGCAKYEPPIKSEVEAQRHKILKVGDQVMLFHSGTEDVKKVICIGDVIPVFLEESTSGVTKRTEVGKVKVLEYAGDHCFKAQVVEGQMKDGAVAIKQNAACLVYTPE